VRTLPFVNDVVRRLVAQFVTKVIVDICISSHLT
jgi:hypothetical protein